MNEIVGPFQSVPHVAWTQNYWFFSAYRSLLFHSHCRLYFMALSIVRSGSVPSMLHWHSLHWPKPHLSGSVPTAEHIALTLHALAKALPVGISAKHISLTLHALAKALHVGISAKLVALTLLALAKASPFGISADFRACCTDTPCTGQSLTCRDQCRACCTDTPCTGRTRHHHSSPPCIARSWSPKLEISDL